MLTFCSSERLKSLYFFRPKKALPLSLNTLYPTFGTSECSIKLGARSRRGNSQIGRTGVIIQVEIIVLTDESTIK